MYLNGLDLFSGGGGLAQALEPWVTPLAYCENDRHAQAVLLSRMDRGELSPAPIWDDVQTLRGHMLLTIDIIVAGFPCQDVSLAGTRVGLDGKRSGLFFEIIRLAGELRPKFIFLENVPGIIPFLDQITGALAGLRYDCRWQMLSAQAIGAPHKRERWFLLANANGKRGRIQSVGKPECGDKTDPIDNGEKQLVADTVGRQRCKGYGKQHELRHAKTSEGSRRVGQVYSDRARPERTEYPFDAWALFPKPRPENIKRWPQGIPKPTICRGDDGMEYRSHALRILGNGVVPAQAREAFMRLMGLGETRE